MAVDIGASGFVGIAKEVTAGTYVAPTKYFPIRNESLTYNQDTVWRRVIRGTADVIGAIQGPGRVEGDIEMELLEDVLPYFLNVARGTLTKTSDTAVPPNHTYVYTPGHYGVSTKTLSITVVRSGVAFGYTGCVLGSLAFGVDDGMATSTFTVLGRSEGSQAVPIASYSATDQPFSLGQWNIQVPTGTQIFDADNFSFETEDNAEAQNRLGDLAARFVSFGERDVTMSLDRDFDGRAEYDIFKAVTSRSLQVALTKSATRKITIEMPVSYIDGYEVGLSGVGDLVRASVTYRPTHDSGIGASYKITTITGEDFAP